MEVGTRQVVVRVEVGTQQGVIVPPGCRLCLALATIMMAKSNPQWDHDE